MKKNMSEKWIIISSHELIHSPNIIYLKMKCENGGANRKWKHLAGRGTEDDCDVTIRKNCNVNKIASWDITVKVFQCVSFLFFVLFVKEKK